MHTGGHGHSKSRKPEVELGVMPEGINLTKEQIEEIIVNYAKQNVHQAQIGQRLKERHNVRYVKQVFGKRLGSVLEEKGLLSSLPRDLLDLIKKAVGLRTHLEKNHRDTYNRVRLGRVESKIWRLTRYYKRTGVLPADWKYEPEKAALLIRGE